MEAYLGLLATIGLVFYAVGQFRSGSWKKSSEDASSAKTTIDLLKARADAFEKELADARADNKANHEEIIRLQEANKHKDQLLEQYLKIITNRNPELEQTLRDVRNFLESLNKKINDGTKVEIQSHEQQA